MMAPDALTADRHRGRHRDVPEPVGQRVLEQLQAEVNDLLNLLKELASGQADLSHYAVALQQWAERIGDLIEKVDIPDAPAEQVDIRRHIRTAGQRIVENPLMRTPEQYGTAESSQQFNRELRILDEQASRLLMNVGLLTIPHRLQHWLADTRPGYYIPFHQVFSDEIPNRDDRVKILRAIAWVPNQVENGLADSSTGLIYRYSANPWWQAASIAGLVAVIVAIAVGLLWIPTLLSMAGVTLAVPGSQLLGLWIGVVVGVSVHAVVATAKRQRSEPELPPPLPLSDLPKRINAQFGDILLKVGLTLIGVFALIASVGLAAVSLFEAFLAGYSLDSVVEIFGSSLEQRATRQGEALKGTQEGA